jgi:hypothetical protein
MAVLSVATTSTLEGFRTTFNSLSTNQGDLTSLTTSAKSNIVAAINEVNASVTTAFTIRDSSSTTQRISAGDVFTIASGNSNITAVVSSTDTLTVTLASNITGLTSLNATTITENNIRVATQPFAIAQAVALG